MASDFSAGMTGKRRHQCSNLPAWGYARDAADEAGDFLYLVSEHDDCGSLMSHKPASGKRRTGPPQRLDRTTSRGARAGRVRPVMPPPVVTRRKEIPKGRVAAVASRGRGHRAKRRRLLTLLAARQVIDSEWLGIECVAESPWETD
jgi:hypothetical protein